MPRTDAIVLGAGIVGVSTALQLRKRGLSVALIDRRGVAEETSYGNTGVIEGQTLFPPAFPRDFGALLRIALKRAPEANYHLASLPGLLPWLLRYRASTSAEGNLRFVEAMRPLFSRAVAEHETLLAESGAMHLLRKTGWIKIYRGDASFAGAQSELSYARELGLAMHPLDAAGAQALEPSLNPVFRHAVHWPGAASVSDPAGVSLAYAARFEALGGTILRGDARTLRRDGGSWRVTTEQGEAEAEHAVVALGPWGADLMRSFGLDLPLVAKRGYHRHFRPAGNAALSRPIVDVEYGYALAPQAQGHRLTTGAEFTTRDAAPTPVQFDRLLPAARDLFPLGERADDRTWLGSRPAFSDSRPVIGAAPGQPGLMVAFGHVHWGLTLGPITGRLVADLITGEPPVVDPAPYAPTRFRRA